MAKRILLFLLTNILVVACVSLILNILGVKPYLSANGIDYMSLLIFCLVWGMVGSIISLSMSKWMAKRAMGVQVMELNGQYGDLVRLVHRLASRAGISKMPEVGIYDSAEVNAFATGPSKNNSLVAVSTGLLQKMNDDEVEGVLAHEIAHVANGDMITMALVQGVVNAFVMFFSRIVAFALDQAMKDEDGRGGLGMFGHMIAVFVLDILFGFLAAPIVAWFSRYREFKADAGGASLAGKHKMIAALERLKTNYDYVDDKTAPSMAAFKISSHSRLSFLFASHPPLDSRIEALKRS